MPALWLQSARRRPATAVGLFLIVTVASASAVAGPMLVRAAEQSGLRTDLARAAPGHYDITVSADTGDNLVPHVITAVHDAAAAANSALFEPPVVIVRTQQAHSWRIGTGGARTTLVAGLSDECASFAVSSGHCPTETGQVLVPDGTNARPGEQIVFAAHKAKFEVSGSYRPQSLPGWLTDAGTSPLLGLEQTVEQVDPEPTVIARDHLRPGALHLDQLAAAAASYARVVRARLRQSVVSAADSRLPLLAGRARADRRVATVVGLLIVVPLVLLCWYALVLIMQLIAIVRSREWALGRLRGMPLPTWLRSLYAEPAALLAAGALIGFVAGVGVAGLTVRATMAGGTPLEPGRVPVLVSFDGTLLGAVVGVAVATLRGARSPLATLLQQSAEPTRLSRAGTAAQVLVLAAAILAIVQLATQRQVTIGAGDLGVLLPGLLAAAVSLALIRIAARTVRRRTGRPPRSIRTLLVGRRLARNPALLARYLVVAVASAVIVFAVSLLVIMQRNVRTRADNRLGAATVVDVGQVAAPRLMRDVSAADPSGRYAMAVEQLVGPTAGGTSRLVAVDTDRLAAVSYWQPSWAGLSAGQVRSRLAPAHRRSIVLRGTQLTMSISNAQTATAPYDVDPTAPAPRPIVKVVLLAGDRWITVPLGPLSPGRHTWRAPMSCARGCVLRGIQFVNTTDTLYSGSATITAISTDTEPAATFATALHTTADWQTNLLGAQPGLPVDATPHGTADGLTVAFRDHTGQSAATVQPADGPAILPAVLARGTDAEPLPAFGRAVDGTGLEGAPIPVAVVGRAAALPNSVADGALVDLSAAARLSDPAASQSVAQVWLAADAPPSLIAALRHTGLTITRTAHAAAIRDELLAAAPVRAVVAGIAGIVLLVLLGAVAVGAGVAIDAERRRAHVRVLRDTGLTGRAIRRLSLLDIVVPATSAVLVGAVTGLVSLLIAGPRLPLFADPAGPPLATSPAWLLTVLVGAALIVIVLVAAALLTRLEYRTAIRSQA